MRKWYFWLLQLAVALLHGTCFYMASLHAMERGIAGVDNQAGLLIIPLLWCFAAAVLLAVEGYVLARGRRIGRNCRVSPLSFFRFAGLRKKAIVHRAVFGALDILLMLAAYFLFAGEGVWAAGYALSGGGLLLLLSVWHDAGAATIGVLRRTEASAFSKKAGL